MTWVLVVVLLVLAGLGYLVVMQDRPRYLRGQRVEVIKRLAEAFAMEFAEGSVLTMEHDEKPGLIELVKGPYTGQASQEVSFRIASTHLTPKERHAVADALSSHARQADRGAHEESWDEATSTAYLEITISGAPGEIAEEVLGVAKVVVDALGLGGEQPFTFHQRGEKDMRVWRSVNRDLLREMSDGNFVHRWVGRAQLRKLDEEQTPE